MFHAYQDTNPKGFTVMNIKRGGKLRRCYMQIIARDTYRILYMEI